MKKDIHPDIQIRFRDSEKAFGPGPCRLLELIQETGSIQKACQSMDLSYSKAMKLIKTAEKKLGLVLLERKSGGAGGGGSAVTREGQILVRDYRRMEAEVQRFTEEAFGRYFGDGEYKEELS